MRAGRAARASRCSSSSTTRKAARTACCTATPASRRSCRRWSTPQAFEARHLSMESMYEYGSRVGVWRILREFERRGLPLTVFGVAMALRAQSRAAARRSWTSATRSPATAGAGSTTSTCREATEREHIATSPRRIITRADRRRLAARLVHRPRQPEHPPPGRRPRRLRLRQRLLRRRPAVLDAGRQDRRHAGAAPGRARTRSTPTTCASSAAGLQHRRRSSSPTCGTPSTCCTPKATEVDRRR